MLTSKIIPVVLLIFLAALSHLHLKVFAQVGPQNSTSPFDFLKSFQGSEKGQKVKGLNELKTFLKQFGYMDPDQNPTNVIGFDSRNNYKDENDYFDEKTENAIKAYQRNFNLTVTGRLDASTVSLMRRPRCGMTDKNIRKSVNVITPNYKFFSNNEKWGKSRLIYAFMNGTPKMARDAVWKALREWQGVTHFTFVYTNDYNKADLKFSFQKRDHGDNNPFDGPGGSYAHAWAPPIGHVHFDSEEHWALGPRLDIGKADIYTVALHEIGHALGLQHSQVASAVMWPYIGSGEVKGLDRDDIQGIRALYNLK